MELQKFAEMWCDDEDRPDQVREEDLRLTEAKFSISFPKDYVSQVLAVGLPCAVDLLDAIADKDLDLHDISMLCTPNEIIEETEGWRLNGMPDQLLIIGNDCMGNMFCFDIPELSKGVKQSAAVFFWDHDFGETTKIAGSFSAWISSYIDPWK